MHTCVEAALLHFWFPVPKSVFVVVMIRCAEVKTRCEMRWMKAVIGKKLVVKEAQVEDGTNIHPTRDAPSQLRGIHLKDI